MANRTRNQIFTFLGAKPANHRWSWCALSPNHQGAVFTLWADLIVDGQPYHFFTGGSNIRSRPGATDMKKAFGIVLRKKIPAFGLVCIAADPSVSPRSIAEIDADFLIRIQIEQDKDEFFAKLGAKVRLREVRREMSGALPIEEDGLSDLEEAPPGTLVPDRAVISGVRVVRNQKVRDFVIRSAGGRCEFCEQRGFQMKDGRYYLEAHHIILLSSDGSDTVDNVIALCADHHRQAHYGAEAEALEKKFIECIKRRLTRLRGARANAGSRHAACYFTNLRMKSQTPNRHAARGAPAPGVAHL